VAAADAARAWPQWTPSMRGRPQSDGSEQQRRRQYGHGHERRGHNGGGHGRGARHHESGSFDQADVFQDRAGQHTGQYREKEPFWRNQMAVTTSAGSRRR